MFFKMFLWFWLVTVVIVISLMFFNRTPQRGPEREQLRNSTLQATSVESRKAVEIFERDGAAALNDYCDRLNETSETRLLVFDSSGRTISGIAYPQEMLDILDDMRNDRGPGGGPFRRGFAERTVTGDSGTVYRVVSMSPPPLPLDDNFRDPFSSLLSILLILVVSAGVYYWLARHFTQPLDKLNAAVYQFADGDMTVRIGPSMSGRNDEYSALASAFDSMADRIQALLQTQKTLLRDVSHELRSPLARLNVALELSRKQCGPAEAKSLDRIAREADKLNDLIGQIVALNLVESGVSSISRTLVDLADVVQEVADDSNFEANSRNREVRVVTLEPCTIIGNEELLRRAIENVIRNGILYTEENTSVEVSLVKTDKLIQFSVRDHGPGVPESEIGNIFKPFYRVGDDRDRQSGGAGIGLAITETAVRMHNGVITASNAKDGGLLVVMSFSTA